MDAAAEDIKDSLALERQLKAYEAGNFRRGSGPSVSTMAPRSFQAQKKCAEMYARALIEEDEPSDLSTRADALRAYVVDPQALHRATKPAKKKTKTNENEGLEDLASTSEEEKEEDTLQRNVDVSTNKQPSCAKRGARRRLRSRLINNTLKTH